MSIIERALAQVDRRGFDPADIDKGEQLLVGFADTHAVKDLRILAEQVVDRIDPDGTLPKDQLNHDRRHVEFHQRGDGSWAGTLRLTGALGAKLQAVLGPLAKPRINLVNGPDGRLVETRMSGITGSGCTTPSKTSATGCSASDALPDSGGTPATVIITIDLEDLLARTGYGITCDGTLIPTDQVRRMANQAEIYPRLPGPQRGGTRSGPDPTDRHPRPNPRPVRPRRRVFVSRLRPSPGMVRTTPRHSLD